MARTIYGLLIQQFWYYLLFVYHINDRSADNANSVPVMIKKTKTDDVGFGGIHQDHYAECYPG